MKSFEKLSATALKLIALFAMTLDHLQYFLGDSLGIPFWVRIIGRIAAPIFIFLVAEGAIKTSSPIKYLIRLYLRNLFMALVSLFFCSGTIVCAIAGTMFYIVLLIRLAERIRAADGAQRLKFIFIIIAVLVVPSWLQSVTAETAAAGLVAAFVPSVMSVEGSYIMVALGIAFYLGDTKKAKLINFALFCALYFALTVWDIPDFAANWRVLFTGDIQWLMILALPLLALYNGQRGRGWRWLFYIYYPAHIYLLYWLSLVIV